MRYILHSQENYKFFDRLIKIGLQYHLCDLRGQSSSSIIKQSQSKTTNQLVYIKFFNPFGSLKFNPFIFLLPLISKWHKSMDQNSSCTITAPHLSTGKTTGEAGDTPGKDTYKTGRDVWHNISWRHIFVDVNSQQITKYSKNVNIRTKIYVK